MSLCGEPLPVSTQVVGMWRVVGFACCPTCARAAARRLGLTANPFPAVNNELAHDFYADKRHEPGKGSHASSQMNGGSLPATARARLSYLQALAATPRLFRNGSAIHARKEDVSLQACQ